MPDSTHTRPIEALGRYAVRFHEALGDGHAIASPLGAYLLLAVIAPLAEGGTRAELEAVLGMSAEEARAFVSALLAAPHPAIAPALAIWADAVRTGNVLDGLPAAIGNRVESGPIPSQSEADEWVRTATGGLLSRLPVAIDPLTVCVLVSALATKAIWEDEFGRIGAKELGRRSWDPKIKYVLHKYATGGQVILWTESAGLVAALVSPTQSEMLVVSVIAAPDVLASRVIAAAHEVAALASGRSSTAIPRSLFDLPLGAGHAWELTEREFETDHPGELEETAEVKLPSWRVTESSMDLLRDPAFGFRAAALGARLPPIAPGYEFQAVQATTGSFDRHGFSAAAVTVMHAMQAMAMPHWERPRSKGRHRYADVRFARPFAVVAVATSPAEQGPWRGVPLFSAWVTEAVETERY